MLSNHKRKRGKMMKRNIMLELIWSMMVYLVLNQLKKKELKIKCKRELVNKEKKMN
jgi:hypothetical protein